MQALRSGGAQNLFGGPGRKFLPRAVGVDADSLSEFGELTPVRSAE